MRAPNSPAIVLLLISVLTLSLAAPAPTGTTSVIRPSSRPSPAANGTIPIATAEASRISSSTLRPTTFSTSSKLRPTASPTSSNTRQIPSSTSSLRPKASSIGNIPAPPITVSDDPERPFEVAGNTFADQEEAVDRACSIQNNRCADGVNAGTVGAEVSDCKAQEEVCKKFGP